MTLAAKPMTGIDDKADFIAWLQQQNAPEAQYAFARSDTASGYNMSGHFHSGFFGIREFFRANPNYQGQFLTLVWRRSFWKSHQPLAADFRRFVRVNWQHFPGQKNGDWRKKLPPWLGGTQKSGGAGSGLVSRLFILLDRYGQQRGY
jgi:hypothetical protein